MVLNLHFDDIIYQLQATGGISVYWREITSKISSFSGVSIIRTEGRKLNRYFPVASKANIFHSSYFRLPCNSKVKKVVTVYDFVYELGFLRTSGSILNVLQKKVAIESADAIICISENTKKDLLGLYPILPKNPSIFVVYLGCSFNSCDKKNYPEINCSERLLYLNQIGVLDKYILFVGGRISYKNFKYALSAFARSSLLDLGYKIICTGKNFSRQEKELISRIGLQSHVLVVENTTFYELKYLYHNAFSLIYPSLYEGFGLPPLEAMSCGCPVIASNTSSLPEVIGNAGLLVNPYNVDSAVDALEKLLNHRFRNECIRKGIDRSQLFSWEEAANKHFEVYKIVTR